MLVEMTLGDAAQAVSEQEAAVEPGAPVEQQKAMTVLPLAAAAALVRLALGSRSH